MVLKLKNTASAERKGVTPVPKSAESCSFEEGLQNRRKFVRATEGVLAKEPLRPDYTKVDEAVRFVITHYSPKEIIVFGQSAKGIVGDDGVEMLIVKNYRNLLDTVIEISTNLIVQTEINSTISLISVAEYNSMSVQPGSILNNVLTKGYIAYATW